MSSIRMVNIPKYLEYPYNLAYAVTYTDMHRFPNVNKVVEDFLSNTLSKEQEEVIKLRFQEQLTYKQISEICNSYPTAIKKIEKQAFQIMKSHSNQLISEA